MERENKIILNQIKQQIINATWKLPRHQRAEIYAGLTEWSNYSLYMCYQEEAKHETNTGTT